MSYFPHVGTIDSYTVPELIGAYRKAATKIRTIDRNLRLGLYQGRNSNITHDALSEARTIIYKIDAELARRGERELAGALIAEHKLAARISQARDDGQDRFELKVRLNAIRRQLRYTLRTGHVATDTLGATVKRANS
jgi:hypothetical protein